MIDLRLGDALDIRNGLPALADRSIDVVITDPPFDARTHRAALDVARRQRGDRKVGSPLPFPPLTAEQVATIAHHFARIARRWIVVFTAERQLETWAAALEMSGARVIRLGIALRTNPRPQLTGDRPAPGSDFLVIAHSRGEPMRWNGGGRPAIWRSPAARFDPGGQVHPTQKPLALMRALVEDFTAVGETVLDPFAGSGTTAVACHQVGRRFLGWERDPRYYELAVRRIAQVQQQLRLPIERTETEQVGLDLAKLEVQRSRGG